MWLNLVSNFLGEDQKANADDIIPTIIPNETSSKEARQSWARLIQKIYEVDPLVCPKCQGSMKIIFIIYNFAKSFSLFLIKGKKAFTYPFLPWRGQIPK
jgi:hypothetical protein